MEAKVIQVTPFMAKNWLNNTEKENRKLKNTVVETYARDMKNGKWQLNYEPIVIDKKGNVINGQHRLNAVILANTEVEMMVVQGAENGIYLFDAGSKRDVADTLFFEGYDKSVANRFTVATVKALLYIKNHKRGGYTTNDVEEVVDKYKKELTLINTLFKYPSASKTNTLNVRSSAFSVPVLCAYICGVPYSMLKEFVDIARTGFYEKKEQTAAVSLRNDFLTGKLSCRSKTGLEHTIHAVEKAIYDYVRGASKNTYKNKESDIYTKSVINEEIKCTQD